MAQQEDVFKKIVSHCKEYGFVFPSSDIYDGLGAVRCDASGIAAACESPADTVLILAEGNDEIGRAHV